MSLSLLKRIWPPLVILAAGLLIAVAIAASGPEAPKRPPRPDARLVAVEPLALTDARARVVGMGTVRPARAVNVTAQVGGQVVATEEALAPGAYARADEPLLRIDPRDYELVVRQRRADLARAEQAWKLESGQQAIAAREYELLGDVVDQETAELVLRKPQLATAASALDAARAALEKAQLDLERTVVRAPFNCIVREKYVDRGAIVSGNTPIAAVVGTDAFWVEVSVPLEKLRWIEVPADGTPGSQARIRQPAVWPEGVTRPGRVLRLLGDLEPQGRMARLLVEVADPYARNSEQRDMPPLLIDAFVEVEILGRELENVVRVPRRHLHNGYDVWLRGVDGRLEIRTVTPLFAGDEEIFVAAGLVPGEELVVSDLATPVAGLPLRTATTDAERGGEGAPR